MWSSLRLIRRVFLLLLFIKIKLENKHNEWSNGFRTNAVKRTFRKGAFLWGWSGSGSVSQDHSDHGASIAKEPTNPLWSRIRRFLWCTMIRVIWDHWSPFWRWGKHGVMPTLLSVKIGSDVSWPLNERPKTHLIRSMLYSLGVIHIRRSVFSEFFRFFLLVFQIFIFIFAHCLQKTT